MAGIAIFHCQFLIESGGNRDSAFSIEKPHSPINPVLGCGPRRVAVQFEK